MQYPRFLLAITLLGATPVAALHAQSDAAEQRARREQQRSAQTEAKIERLRREIDVLVRRRLDVDELRSEEAADSARRDLEPQIARAARKLAELQSSLVRENVEQQLRDAEGSAAQVQWQAQVEATRAAYAQQWPTPSVAGRQPTGWVGISFSGPTRTWYDSSKGLVIYHYDYPVVLTVEPGSPAERAGIEAGDTVLAYDGRDVRRRAILLGRQLRPGTRLVVRVRRDGGTRDIPVAVERRPASFAPSYTVVAPPEPMDPLPPSLSPMPRTPRAPRATRIVELPADMTHVLIAPAAPPSPTPRGSRASRGSSAAAALAPEAPLPPLPATPTTIVVSPIATVFDPAAPGIVVGAQVARMNAGLRDVFGVAGGVLVLNVAAGSPAAGSGLRAGDVIMRVNGDAITSPLALHRAVEACRDRTARLDVVRKKKSERLTLRW